MYTITIIDNTNGITVTKEFYSTDANAIHEFVDMWCDLEEVEESEEDYEPDYDECGFNPYMGCYDFDC